MYEISPKSSIFADTRAAATSGGAFALGGNPNLSAIFGGSSSSVPQWVMPAAITAAIAIALYLVRSGSRK
jgi:hypothetical protein